ncbi:MAG: hypothetical protein A2X13_04390 [Bacteroidetes bacterium GWC2_33_15]|nr:MAG: hypothetical protein A2X10_06235 [Bacteroidetes bacterium GWA2_33_15]OFX49770.1 MAG: hypothetical protein A2X13_04390 [Bacteroidetes bacterium GWC2_33_15]OFX64961.1 MAG: hypothetical protein A2X15_06310 [Bacteroidetes bacterium GWB2_32_14]OFX69077.1 MAG: hypothetical protein A2X14_13845 [Bacteroidetes bacterium GWD2_33_33]HAN18347.1 M48 family peptidase [Bacteroidales bacterium]
MADKLYFVEGIGNVKFRKNSRSKAIRISIQPLKGVIVNMPLFVSYSDALRIVEKRKPWIYENLPKIKAFEKKYTCFNEKSEFKTRSRILNISSHNNIKFTARLTPDTIDLRYPDNSDVENQNIQKLIRTSIDWALRIEAKEFLPGRTKQLAEQLNFNYKKVFLKNNKSNWGSCSAINNINLNIHLMRLPDNLIDYVIIHELCHTIEKNHKAGFWNLMNSILGDAKSLSKELKKHSIQIY